jgi:hypothetical protein
VHLLKKARNITRHALLFSSNGRLCDETIFVITYVDVWLSTLEDDLLGDLHRGTMQKIRVGQKMGHQPLKRELLEVPFIFLYRKFGVILL